MSDQLAEYPIENMEDAHVVAEMLRDIQDTPRYESTSDAHTYGSKEIAWASSLTEMRSQLRNGATGQFTVELEVDECR